MINSSKIVSFNGHQINVKEYRKSLISWGRNNFRCFPWRFIRDPYKILVAEVMLKRTKAKQVVPVYNSFVKHYPDISFLAGTSTHDLHNILGPLGLRWRVELFLKMIRIILDQFNGIIPVAYDDLMSLPGVSYYTAGAVRCFALNYPEALIDTNTMRIVCNIFGKKKLDSIRRNKEFMELMKSLVDPDFPRDYNYALLDLADSICHKGTLGCINCPISNECLLS